jgi:hypothetical protein
MEPRHLPPSRNIEDRRDEPLDPLMYMPGPTDPRRVLTDEAWIEQRDAPPRQSGPGSRALGIEDIGRHPRPPSLYDMMQQGRSLPLPQVQESPPWRMIPGR